MQPASKQSSIKDFFKPTISPSLQLKRTKKEKTIFPEVPGLSLITNFVTEAEEKFIWQGVSQLPWITDYKRRYQVHGYSYDPINKDVSDYMGELPHCVSFLADRLKEEGIMPSRPDQCGVNEYEPGQGIGPHVDRGMFGDQIVNISLGSDIVMDFYGPEPEQKKSILLPKRSLLLVEGAARYEWKHGIALRKSDKLDDGTIVKRNKRISVTFRIYKKEQNKYYQNKHLPS